MIPNPSADEAVCVDLLPRVSRTFAISIELLPDSLREPVRVGYLLCRVVDTIEDDERVPWSVREELFARFDRALLEPDAATSFVDAARAAGLGHGDDAALVAVADAVFRRFHAQPGEVRAAMLGPIQAMSRGMRAYTRRFVADGRLVLHTLGDLEDYCYYVAGTVGELLTALFLRACPLDGARRDTLRREAVPFGLALQIVNIVKDCAEDAERGVCFVPRAVVERHGLRPEDLLDPAHREAALDAIAEVCGVAGAYVERAMRYTAAWPADGAAGSAVRQFCLVPLLLAIETLAVVVRGEDTLVAGRTPKVSRETVGEVLALAQDASCSDAAFVELAARYGFDVQRLAPRGAVSVA